MEDEFEWRIFQQRLLITSLDIFPNFAADFWEHRFFFEL